MENRVQKELLQCFPWMYIYSLDGQCYEAHCDMQYIFISVFDGNGGVETRVITKKAYLKDANSLYYS